MILVTGATGNIGFPLVQELRAAGVPVRALVRSERSAAKLAGTGVELVQGDLDDPGSLRQAFAGAERVFLLSAFLPDQETPQLNAVEAARQAGVKHIVKLSAIGASLESPYELSRIHGRVEHAVRSSGVPATFLQPTFFMQNFLSAAETVATQQALYQPYSDKRISVVHAADIAAAGAAVLTQPGHEGKTYVLATEAFTMDELAEMMGEIFRRPVSYYDLSVQALGEFLLRSQMPEPMVRQVQGLAELVRTGGSGVVTEDFQQLTGRSPRTMRDFLIEHKAQFVRNAPGEV